ncbi:MAG TPA: carboxymuconolactone decarboxylase family protein [Acidobacteriota bacterium]
MNHEELEHFREYREKMNTEILAADHLGIKRFFNLDTQAYAEGALGSQVKEMLGLVASMVLRCDDCITYHIVRCAEENVKREEMIEVFNVALVVGGSIVIPHLRRAFETMNQIYSNT